MATTRRVIRILLTLTTRKPPGTKIAFSTYRDVFTLGSGVYVMDADGANPLRLSNNVF